MGKLENIRKPGGRTQTDVHNTPIWLFNELNEVYGFTLDPCCDGKVNAKCSKFFTPLDDGLAQSWCGEVVFMNPPYSNLYSWMEKAYQEFIKNNTTVVCLLPVRSDTKWWHEFALKGSITFIKGAIEIQ